MGKNHPVKCLIEFGITILTYSFNLPYRDYLLNGLLKLTHYGGNTVLFSK